MDSESGSSLCPHCGKALAQLRIVRMAAEDLAERIPGAVVVTLNCPHCSIAISGQILTALPL